MYSGGIRNFAMHGEGVLKNRGGTKWIGQFDEGRKEGQMVFEQEDGTRRTALFTNDIIQTWL